MDRMNSTASPSCASNIDYHLSELAKCYQESGTSLLAKLVDSNPKNAKYCTPKGKRTGY